MKKLFNKEVYLNGIAQAATENKGVVHIIPSIDGWYLKIGGDINSIKLFNTKEEAISEAESITPKKKIVIHDVEPNKFVQ